MRVGAYPDMLAIRSYLYYTQHVFSFFQHIPFSSAIAAMLLPFVP